MWHIDYSYNYCILCFNIAKGVNLKCSHHNMNSDVRDAMRC